MNNRPKIFYTGGFISLLFIPLLCYCFIEKQLEKRNRQRCLEIVTCNRDTSCQYCYKCIPPGRNYQDIKLTGNEIEDKRKLRLIDSVAKSYYNNDDSISGLHVVFGDNSKYGSFIRVIDICKLQKIPFYMIKDNQIWILYGYVNLEINGKTFRTKYLGGRRRLIKGEYYDYEVEIKYKPNNDCVSDIIYSEEADEKNAVEKRQRNLWDYVYKKRISLGILAIVYSLLFFLTIRKVIKRLKQFFT